MTTTHFRRVAVLLAGLALLVGAAGCGSDSSPGAGDNGGDNSGTTEETSTTEG